ncbi:hypothetical protein VitviT2T_015387 [Vitis vinifera]|uniref:Kinesin motor domain-containing protein n=1 Tax=Vitis vinifera TaxID=29760 RepID=A0ABY9CNU1_VITVI|nr:hypothetical protein VitviT2T_015387 [Vitis vinifera]
MEPETNVDHDTNVDAENSDTPYRIVAPEYELQPSVPINVVSDGEEQPEGNVVPKNRNVWRRRVRRMAPNLLSPYISQPQTKQFAIKIDLKQAATLVVDAYCRLLQYEHEPKSKLFLSPYIAEMVIHSQAKHLVREAVIGRFEPHLYQIDIPYVNVNEVFLPVLIKNHWTLYVYDLENRRIQLLDSRPSRKKTMLSGVQQNLADSEIVDKSKVNGDRLKEEQHINRSIFVLGDVISALAQKSPHVPYRNRGQAKTLIFVHISPEPAANGETISTFKFAERFPTVELGAARVNKDSADVKELKEQIGTQKAALARKEENQRTCNILFPTVLKDREQKPENYTAPRMVLAASGIEHEEFLSIAEPLVSDLPSVPRPEEPKFVYVGGDYRCQAYSGITHLVLAFEVPGGWHNEKEAITLTVLQILMGGGGSFSTGGPGKGMHSRLYLRVLNEYQQLQSFSAFNNIFNNTRIFGIYASTVRHPLKP